ncbi:MFS transporter [Thermodesulfobacteriota bacterium]
MKLLIPRRWAIFVVTALLFILSQFYRTSIAVITPQLISDLSLDTKGLSLVSATFFYAFALAQIPIGIYLDYVGPRKTMTFLSLVAVAGGLLFAWADSPSQLILGRILLGMGMACNLIGTLKLLTLWFDPLRFATISALVISIGTIGNITATTPLVMMVQKAGWRPTFTIFAVINLLLALIFFLITRDKPSETSWQQAPPEDPLGLRATLFGLKHLFLEKDYWIISLGTFCRYGILAAVQALWAGPYLIKVIGLSAISTGNLLFLLNISLILGYPLWGLLSDRLLKTRKWLVTFGLASLGFTLATLAFIEPGSSLLVLSVLFFGIGLFSSVGGLMLTHIKEMMPIKMAGTAMTAINFFTMIGAAVFLQGLGNFMQYVYPQATFGQEAFKGSFLICAVLLAAVTVLYSLTRDTRANKSK